MMIKIEEGKQEKKKEREKEGEKGTKRSASKRANFTWFLWAHSWAARVPRAWWVIMWRYVVYTPAPLLFILLSFLSREQSPWNSMRYTISSEHRTNEHRSSVYFFLKDKQLDPLSGILFWRQFGSVIGRTSTSDVGRPSRIGQLSKT